MPEFPLATANVIHSAANIFVIVGAVFMAGGAIAAYWSGGIREKFADQRISQAEAGAANANEHAARLENEAEQARLETERLKQQFAWRRLNETQSRAIVDSLTGLNLELSLSAIATDPESMLFATDIQRALAAAGFNVQIQSSVLFSSGPVVGIIISGPRDNVTRVGQAFVAAGFNVTGQEQQGDIGILIGSKPPPQ